MTESTPSTETTETTDTDSATTTAVVEAPRPQNPDAGGFIWGTGRRKAAVARVRVRPAKAKDQAKFLINGKTVDDYFSEPRDRNSAIAPLSATETEGKLDIYVNVRGGGYMGQAGAILLGLARALKGYDASLEPLLRKHDFLTRDPREVERKKYGQRGARRRFQFSKR